MKHRHPHVFGDASVANMEDLNKVWEKAKVEEGKKAKVKYEREYAETVLKWMKTTIHEKRPLHELITGDDQHETR